MIIEPINTRRAHFSFSGEPVEQEKLLAVLTAATLAPSAANNQPWRYFYAIQGTAGFDLLAGCLSEGNHYASRAGVLILAAAVMRYNYKDRVINNAHAWHDTGLANAMLMIQATSMGLKTHPMGGFDVDKARKAANLGPDTEPVVMIAVGYPGDEAALPPDLVKRQSANRNRKPLDEVVTLL
ncbi:MAG: nitroreductase family protein [Bacteroidota bacterium]|jgi:nitroreductase